ncbi:hypothetical protein ACA910_012377 [Epithemia clementina (nom. ined.)]
MSHKMWDERYGASGEFVYGTEPNDFLKDTWPTLGLAAGSKCLLLADGEGRNGVYLAQLGMSVTGVDISKVGLDKAQQLASERNVSIETQVADLATYDLGMEQWDAIVSISNHLPPPIRERVLGAIPSALKPGGYFVLEGYTPEQLEYKTGGPPDAAMMYSREMLDEAFGSKNDDSTKRLEIIRNEELVRTVVEGQYHTGKGAVVQFIGKKTMQS